MNIIQTIIIGEGLKIGIVAEIQRFHYKPACERSRGTGWVSNDDIDLIICTGAFEIPLLQKWQSQANTMQSSLSDVSSGGTTHYDYVCNQSAKIILKPGFLDVPVIFGVVDREHPTTISTGTKMGNKGIDSANSAIKMANLMNELKS